MNTDIVDVRRTYDYLRKSQTHLVQSSEIATACVCQNLFKLDYPYGAENDRGSARPIDISEVLQFLFIPTVILENLLLGIIECEEKNEEKIIELKFAIRFLKALSSEVV